MVVDTENLNCVCDPEFTGICHQILLSNSRTIYDYYLPTLLNPSFSSAMRKEILYRNDAKKKVELTYIYLLLL